MNNLLEQIEDSLEQIISDTIDMDWQPRWAAAAIVAKLRDGGATPATLQLIDEILS